MPKIILSGHIEVPADELEQVREALTTHISKTRAEAGCLIFEVTESEDKLGVFTVYEEFESKEAFELHQKRVKESDWGAVTKNVSRHYTIQEVE